MPPDSRTYTCEDYYQKQNADNRGIPEPRALAIPIKKIFPSDKLFGRHHQALERKTRGKHAILRPSKTDPKPPTSRHLPPSPYADHTLQKVH